MNSALIVEDLPEIRNWLGQVARAAFPALQVVTAARRDQALVCVQQTSFDLALIDLGLPDGSGIDVVSTHLEHEVKLTERETDVLQRVAKGYTLPEIVAQFGLSKHTIADHIKQIYRKLNVSSRAEAALEAALEAARRGLVQP
ncbi:MAG: helix-turn-helix transcriptional regulator [Bdellovibrionales bacterium]|nr:helix-turn-helix transcriptional regulator [Ramlibacter sp.]